MTENSTSTVNTAPPRSAFSTGCGIGCGIIAAFLALPVVVFMVGGASCIGCLAMSDGGGSSTPGIDLGSSITATCRVGRGHECQFTNRGVGPGSGCVVVTLRHRRTGESITSQSVCSGVVLPGDTSEHSVMFVGRQPVALRGAALDRTCEMEVVPADDVGSTTDARRSGPPATLCGDPRARGAADRSEWARWTCRSRADAPDWNACLPRSTYADESWLGCPGAERCCPPSRVIQLTEDDVPAFPPSGPSSPSGTAP